MTRHSVLLAATILAVPAVAEAQPFNGIYVGLGAGGTYQSDVSLTPSKGLPAPALSARFDTGFVGVGSVGWGFGNGFRVEAEGDFRDNTLRKLSGTAFPTSAGGRQEIYGGMANVLFDLDISQPWLFPYFGGGVGYQAVNLSNVHATGIAMPAALGAQGSPGNFAYQAIAGLSFPIPHVPGLSVTLEYRFMQVLGGGDYTAVVATPSGIHSGQLANKLVTSNSGLLGVRYAFNVMPPPAPPAPVVAPAPAPARSYVVFFDWDKYNLTDRARQIIAEAAANIAKVDHTRIEVNGYTDTTGTAKYNMALSIRRANAVAAELVRLGVAKSDIAIQGFGDTKLLVPTGPQVREPQNRRVEIIIK